jgi:hypothetical protein
LNSRRLLSRLIASSCSAFVFLLFAFPNYCDRCSYRDIEERFQFSGSSSSPRAQILPACCDPTRGAATTDAGEQDVPPGGKEVSHERISYCIGSTLSTVTTHIDVLGEIRRTVTPETFRAQDTAFARLSVVLDHKESRAPPA